MAEPTDAEVEAMAERLWDVYRVARTGGLFREIEWSELRKYKDAMWTVYGKNHASFIAMARAALEKRDDR